MRAARPGLSSEERAWQDDIGGRLQEAAYARAGTREVLDRQHERIASVLEVTPEMRVLDLGCGVGHLVGWLTRHAPARYHGIDLSMNSVRAARHSTDLSEVSVGDAARLPFRDASYDRVVCNGAAHHLPDLRTVLGEIRRVLRPAGRLVLHEPVDSPVTGAIRRTLFRRSPYESPADLSQKHEFTRAMVERALRDAGFVEVTAVAHDFLAYPLSGMYMELPWSRSRRAIRALIGLECRLDRLTFLRPIWRALSWRVLFTAQRPP
jgi:SAM-dependent methyltransferase